MHRNEDMELFGATREFKVDGSSRNVAQLFADMVKVSNYLLIDALSQGNVVDSVIVFGTLVSHNKEYCIPARYSCDFKTNKSCIEFGKSVSFYDFLSFLSFTVLVIGCK